MKELRKYLSIISHFPCWKRCKTHTLVLERLMMISQKFDLDFTHFLKNKSHPGINLKLKKKVGLYFTRTFLQFSLFNKIVPIQQTEKEAANRNRLSREAASSFLVAGDLARRRHRDAGEGGGHRNSIVAALPRSPHGPIPLPSLPTYMLCAHPVCSVNQV